MEEKKEQRSISFYLPNWLLDKITDAAERLGVSRNGFIRQAVIEKMRRDKE